MYNHYKIKSLIILVLLNTYSISGQYFTKTIKGDNSDFVDLVKFVYSVKSLNDNQFLDTLNYFITVKPAVLKKENASDLLFKRLQSISDYYPVKTEKTINALLTLRNTFSENQKGELYLFRSNCKFLNGNMYHALSDARYASAIFKKSGDVNLINESKLKLSTYYGHVGDYKKSIESCFEVIHSQTKNKNHLGEALDNLSTCYYQIGNIEESIKFELEALNYFHGAKKYGIYASLAVLYYDYNNKNRDYYIAKIKSYGIEKLDLDDQSIVLQLLGGIEEDKGDFESALNYYFQSEQIATKIPNNQYLIFTLKEEAIIFNKLGEYAKAIVKLKKALKLLKPKGNTIRIEVADLISETYEKMGNYKKACEYLHLHIKYSNSTFSTEKKRDILELEKKYQTQKKVLQIRLLNNNNLLLNKKKKISDLKVKNSRNAIIWLTISLILVLGIVALLFKIYKSNKRINNEQLKRMQSDLELIEIKSRLTGEENERKRISQELHDEVGNELLAISQHLHGNDQQELRRIYSQIRSLSHKLNIPANLTEINLIELIKELSRQILIPASIDVSMSVFPIDSKIIFESSTHISMYRVIQELFINISKHSHATEVEIGLTIHDSAIIIVIEDNGSGFDTKRVTNGIGMQSVLSRIESLKGKITTESRKNMGTIVIIEIPKGD